MFVLNDRQVMEYEQRKMLHIQDFELSLLHSTYYYFRLGRHYELWDPDEKDFVPGRLGNDGRETLMLPPRGYARIRSFERFTLSDDELRLSYEQVVTDPGTFTAPARVRGEWMAVPGIEIQLFDMDCSDNAYL